MPKIALCPCDSSRIHAHGYDPETQTLALRFKGKGGAPGPVYHYAGFPAEEYEALKQAESLGKFFGAKVNIKNDEGELVYPFTRLPDEEADGEEGAQ